MNIDQVSPADRRGSNVARASSLSLAWLGTIVDERARTVVPRVSVVPNGDVEKDARLHPDCQAGDGQAIRPAARAGGRS